MKNLAKHKIAVKTREVLVQAIYQHLFQKTPSKDILEQFPREFFIEATNDMYNPILETAQKVGIIQK